MIGILTKVFCTSGPNLVILAWMGGESWCGQAQYGVNLDFQVKFDLEGQGPSVHKTIGTLTKAFCIFGPNLVILAWTGPELSCGQASDWHTDRQTDRHTHTDAGNNNTRWPKLASGKKLSHRGVTIQVLHDNLEDLYLDTEVTIQYISQYVSKHSKMPEGCHE